MLRWSDTAGSRSTTRSGATTPRTSGAAASVTSAEASEARVAPPASTARSASSRSRSGVGAPSCHPSQATQAWPKVIRTPGAIPVSRAATASFTAGMEGSASGPCASRQPSAASPRPSRSAASRRRRKRKERACTARLQACPPT